MASPPSCYLYRDTQHPRTPRARARMLHSAGLNVPRLYSDPRLLFFFFHASALFHRAREPGVSSSRSLFFLLPPMEITPRTGRSLERNGSSNREHREFSSFSFFFADDGTIIHGDGVKLKVKLITHRYNFDFWNYYYP